jgi:glycosyltransferase involved in cell wall biosynthesis
VEISCPLVDGIAKTHISKAGYVITKIGGCLKRIVHITTVHRVFDVRIFFKECRSLVAAGYDVILIAPHVRDEVVQGVRIKALPIYNRRFKRFVLATFRALVVARKIPAHLYHFHDPELMPVGLVLRLLGRRVIYDIHEDLPRALLVDSKDYIPQRLKKAVGFLAEQFENLASRKFTALVAAWPKIAERFENRNSRTTVVFNYPALEEFDNSHSLEWKRRPECITYIGGISRERGIQKITEALNLLPASESTRLILAGRFRPSRLENEMRSLPGWRRIDYRGWVSREQVAEILGQTRAGLLLMAPLESCMNLYPIKLFEYMAAGIPVVASNFPLWKGIIEKHNCGICVDPNNIEEISQAIRHLINNPNEAAQMGDNGREAVEKNYIWPSEEEKLVLLYKQILSS